LIVTKVMPVTTGVPKHGTSSAGTSDSVGRQSTTTRPGLVPQRVVGPRVCDDVQLRGLSVRFSSRRAARNPAPAGITFLAIDGGDSHSNGEAGGCHDRCTLDDLARRGDRFTLAFAQARGGARGPDGRSGADGKVRGRSSAGLIRTTSIEGKCGGSTES
jgi:hypothetical protein